ncbi:MAG: 2,3-epoxybenzoyl-CoA dihydrolase [Alphaproteobacteria bacterium]|nr:2,3-epoxybenzoyl-CoA dihydrolase [Alphaproteobacteria bacterium]
MIDFRTDPARYRHWTLACDGPVATLSLAVDEKGGLAPGYELKMNSYDLGVDIELYDAIQRLRFEHPEVRTVVVTSGRDRVFSAGANIKMLAQSTHQHKVNFCKFTNETRLSIEDASQCSGQRYLCAVNGPAAGGGYELALAADWITMVDDGNTSVALPEVPLLAVLPGTGGLTRLVDKRRVRRDHADFLSTVEEGVKGRRAVDWKLVDEIAPSSGFRDAIARRARALAETSDRPADANGIVLTPLARSLTGDRIDYGTLAIEIDRAARTATLLVKGPEAPAPDAPAAIHAQGTAFWPLALARALDDAVLHLRFNEPAIGVWVLKSEGEPDSVAAYDALLRAHAGDWLVREIVLYWKRTLKRLDVTSRSIFALVEPGSCFGGFLFELVLAADQSFMLDGVLDGDNRPPAAVRLSGMNFGPLPMGNGLTRLQTRFLDDAAAIERAASARDRALDADEAGKLGLVTFTPDDIDWEDEVRIAIEARASYSPDALTGMEANLRMAGPETMETKIFGRLSAWQNWIFQRPNAAGEEGALKLYGTGKRADYKRERV